MKALGDGAYFCAKGHRWLDDTPEPEEEKEERWTPAGVSLSYVPGTVKGGGGSNHGPSPARQKADAYIRRQMPGIHARRVKLDARPVRLTSPPSVI